MANDDDSKKLEQKPVNFSVDPNKTPVLHADSYLIFSNQHTVTINFAQAVIDGQQQNIVSRIALTRDQAKEFLVTLNDHIEKFEV
jgi:hypothetical protein